MKVSELIVLLKDMDPDAEIAFDEGGCYYNINNAINDGGYVILEGKKVY